MDRILIVDDEKFDIVQILRERKYDIYYKKDITYALEAEPFDIIIIDMTPIQPQPSRKGWSLSGNIIRVCSFSTISSKTVSGWMRLSISKMQMRNCRSS